MSRKSSSVTIRDVAQKAGVSPATVSRYLNDSAPISPEVAERIQQVMSELQYVPSAAARQLATQKSRAIGVLLTDLDSVFFPPLISGIESIVQQEGYNLLVASRWVGNGVDAQLPIGPHNADGLIVFPGSLTDDEILKLHQAGFPVVLIYQTPPEGLNIPSVTVWNKRATRELIDHLIEVHHRRRIVFVRGPADNEDSQRRELGYQESLEVHGIAYNPELIVSGEYNRNDAYQAMSKFLENEHPDFDAVFTGNDDSAVGIMNALNEKGLRIPDDISVVGFDDLELSAFLTPPLTTVNAPTEGVGKTAAQYLFKLLASQEVDPVTLLSTQLVIRRSCGCSA
ncbi:MAG: LacI family transcriptional regulator [Anaerolineae bacterium]|nr:LacI family transcriptional regulator [Anaerolineae bacterium]